MAKKMQHGYARVSTFDQHLEFQLEVLNRFECDHIFEDKISGSKSKRPGLDKMMKSLRPGDTVIGWKLDRPGRSLLHLATLLRYFRANNIELILITEGIRISTSIDRFAYTMLSTAAEMERENIIERTRAGLAVARAKGENSWQETEVNTRAMGAGGTFDRKRSGQKAGCDYL